MKINVIELNKEDSVILSVPHHYPKDGKKKVHNVFKEMTDKLNSNEAGIFFTVSDEIELTIIKKK